jgi:hypothetical protein
VQPIGFWEILEVVDHEAAGLVRTGAWIRSRFKDAYRQAKGKRAPATLASRSAHTLQHLWRVRAEAWRRISDVTESCRHDFEAGDDAALVDVVRVDGVNEPWVRDAISALRSKQTIANAWRKQDRVRQTLERIGRALWQPGGRTPELTAADRNNEERRKRKREQVRVAKAATRRLTQYLKHLPALGHVEALREVHGKRSRLEPAVERRVNRALEKRIAERVATKKTP